MKMKKSTIYSIIRVIAFVLPCIILQEFYHVGFLVSWALVGIPCLVWVASTLAEQND